MADWFVSVLVPVYNGERFLPQLIDSLSAQTYGNFEVVFVDDLSTDNSAGIIQAAAKHDGRFKYIRRTTKGKDAGTGIEYGLPYCTGDYYFYMSQDDFIDSDMLEKCVGKIRETQADIVLCNTCFYSRGEESRNFSRYPLNNDYAQALSPNEAFLLSLDWEIGGFGLRKMELVKKVGIVPTYFNSCEYYGICQLLLANKIVFCDSNFYYRSDNAEAITRKQNPHYYIEIFLQDVLLLEKMMESDFTVRQQNARLKQLVRRIKKWHRYYRKNSFGFTAEQDRYYRKTLSACIRRLAAFSWKRLQITNLLKIGALRA